MSQSKREQYILQEAKVLVGRLGYDPKDAGVVREVFEVMSRVDQGAYRAGYDKGHKEGWDDHKSELRRSG